MTMELHPPVRGRSGAEPTRWPAARALWRVVAGPASQGNEEFERIAGRGAKRGHAVRMLLPRAVFCETVDARRVHIRVTAVACGRKGLGVYEQSDFRVSAADLPLDIGPATGRTATRSDSTDTAGLDLSFSYTPSILGLESAVTPQFFQQS
jgi:hypothetical protein